LKNDVTEMSKPSAKPGAIVRCAWVSQDPLYQSYHDDEWGVPEHDDRALFEKLVLDGFQAGLAWITILRKRENFRRAFDGFEPEKIARYTPRKLAALLEDAGIVRNRMKVHGAVESAKAYLRVRDEIGSFDRYIWSFTGGATLQNRWPSIKQIPAKSRESEAMSKDLVARGFRFVGPTICYAFMQAVGIVNDHTVDCFRHARLAAPARGAARSGARSRPGSRAKT
jgi:DNA-3-methyladenine glycosylase I